MNGAAKAAVATAGMEAVDPDPSDPSSALYGSDDADDDERLPGGVNDPGETNPDPGEFDPDPAEGPRKAAKKSLNALKEQGEAKPGPVPDKSTGVLYVVLEEVANGAFRIVRRDCLARNAEHAARLLIEGYEGDDDMTIVAVPERSWRPMKVSIKTERTVSFT